MTARTLDRRPAAYAHAVKPKLPSQAFQPYALGLLRVVPHGLTIALGYGVISATSEPYLAFGASLLIGHGLAGLAFTAHDLSHGSIVRNRVGQRLLELLLWGINFVPPTLWRRVHNQTHHAHAGTPRDPDRAFLTTEQSWLTRVYSRLFYPSRVLGFRHPLFLLHFVPYVLRNIAAALLPARWSIAIVPSRPTFRARHRVQIVAELGVIAALQRALWWWFDGEAWKYLLGSIVPVLVCSAVVMLYIFTNHFLKPLGERADPLLGTLSVQVPGWMNILHDNFSYHTEHHVFPSMNPRYYPLVCHALQAQFPDEYQRLPIGEAWKLLWQRAEFDEAAGGTAHASPGDQQGPSSALTRAPAE